FHPAEVAHEVFQAWLTFAVFEVARRAHLGVDPEDYRLGLGRMLAPFTEVAAANPYAWFREVRTAEDLIEPTPQNRIVGYPYTKTMISIMDVDMAAALVVTSHETADRLGVPDDRRVYLRGSGYAEDPIYVAEHEPMHSSPAMAQAAAEALGAAGIGVDDVAHLDLYSCFTSSVGFACDVLGISPADGRGLTVTGGLPFSGGAGSGYLFHSTATMVDVLRRDPGSFGLVSGVGMHMTKHAFGVYCTEPGTGPVDPAGVGVTVGRRPGPPPRTIEAAYSGPASVAAYTVVHGRSGEPEWGLAVCDLPGVGAGAGGDGGSRRAYARFEDPEQLEEAEASEWVGTTVEIETGEDNVNRVRK
ncbi:MAG TPA: hypothetical protein VGR90_02390, partial [Acidimicrobiales bacterium]|nr:hypothetical protein [Acidimicrobiales bacterium]